MKSTLLANLLMILACVAVSSGAQIDVKGTVSDSLGKPVAGAIVSLKGAGKIDTTDANGLYAIQDPPVSVMTRSIATRGSFDMSFANGMLWANVPEIQTLSVRVFDISGKTLLAMGERSFDGGWQRLGRIDGIASKVMFVRMTSASGIRMIKRLCYDGNKGSELTRATTGLKMLTKRLAATDTLSVTCRAFRRAALPVANYVGVYNVALKNWPANARVLGMKYLPVDTFTMGQAGLNNSVDQAPLGQAYPVHKVTLSAYYIDSTEVTEADFQDLMQYCPTANPGHVRYAIDAASWYDAALYCNARSKREKLDTMYSYTSAALSGTMPNAFHATNLAGCTIHYERAGYRMATEAEWEYACRGKTRTNTYWGTAPDSLYQWAGNNAGGHTNEVARKLPNAFKLYDMAGNVWEWCNDFTVQFTSAPQTDPVGPLTGTNGVQLRGAAWHENYGDVQFYSACRHAESRLGGTFYNNVGFRVVLSER